MQRPDRQAIFLSEDDVVEEIDISSGGAGAGGAGGAEDGSDDGSELAEEVEGEEEEEEGDDAGAAEGADGGSGGGADGPDDACAVFREHSSSVYAVCAVPGAAGDIMLSASGDDTACLWRADTAALIARLSGHTDSVVAVEGSHDGKYLATGSLDGSVRVWNAKGELLHVVEGPSADIEWLSWHSKVSAAELRQHQTRRSRNLASLTLQGHALLAGSADGTAWLWSVSDKSVDCMQVFVGHEGSVTCGAFSASGKTIVTGSADGTVRLWNPKAAQAVHTFEGPGWDGAPVNSLAIANDSPLVAACCQDGVVRLVNLQTLKTVLQYVHGDTPLRGVEPDAEEDAAASIEW